MLAPQLRSQRSSSMTLPSSSTAEAIRAACDDARMSTASSPDAQVCERAVHAIWKSLDEHELVNKGVRDQLAVVLEPLTRLSLGERPQRLIDTLRLPDPIDASRLYWLTRRLLTLVPELQAVANASLTHG